MTPYEYHQTQLGVKIKFLISDCEPHPASIAVISYRALRYRMQRDSSKETELRRACLNSEGLILYSSIEQSWKDLLALKFGPPQEQIKQTYFASQYVRDKVAYDFFRDYRIGAEKRPLSTEQIEEYTNNASVLNTVRIVKNNRRALRRALGNNRMDIWETLQIEVSNFKAVPHTIPVASLRRKFTEYDRLSYSSLISDRFDNANAQKVSARIIKLLNALFYSQEHKPTPTEVARQYDAFLSGYAEVYNPETGELYDPKEFTKLSQATVVNYLSAWENKIGTHHRRGGDRQKLIAAFKPYHSLEQPKFAGSIISIDDRQPPFEYVKGSRVWFYNGIDLASECFTAFVYGKTKEGLILDFYRQLVRNYTEWGFNLPNELEAEMSLNSQFLNSFLKPGYMFPEVRIEANNARGKRIEQYFRPLRYGLEKKRIGWLARPFAKSESNQKGAANVPLIPYNDIIQGSLQDLETWNNMPHSKEKSLTRWEYFCQRQHKELKPTNWRGILPYLGHKTRTSVNVGIMKFRNTEFLLGENGAICFGDDLIYKMKRAEGRQIDIYWLDGNEGQVLKALIYIGEEYIGEAIEKPRYVKAKLEQTSEDLFNRELMSKYVATIEGFRRSQMKQLEPVGIIDSTPTTMNNKFRIPGLKRIEQREAAGEVPDTENDKLFDEPAPSKSWDSKWKI